MTSFFPLGYRLEAASYLAALSAFTALFKTLNPYDQRNLVPYLMERIELDEADEEPEVAG